MVISYKIIIIIIIIIIYSVKKGARTYYDILIQNDNKPNCCEKWDTKLGIKINWDVTFNKIHKIKEIKIRWFQIRITHRILATNSTLLYMGLTGSNVCTFCKTCQENIQHIFWRCEVVQSFWQQLEIALRDNCLNIVSLKFNEIIVLFGHDYKFKSDSTFDLIILHAKYFIYKCKLNEEIPHLIQFKQYLKFVYKIEEHNAWINMLNAKFHTDWLPYKSFIDL